MLLAEPFDMALPSFAQHLKVLEDCGADRQREARAQPLVPAGAGALDEAADWMEAERRRWTERLDRLEVYLDKTERGCDEAWQTCLTPGRLIARSCW